MPLATRRTRDERRANDASVRRNFNRVPWIEMRERLKKDWAEILKDKDVEGTWEALKTELNEAIELWVPLKKSKKRVEPKWMDKEIKKQIEWKKQPNVNYTISFNTIY